MKPPRQPTRLGIGTKKEEMREDNDVFPPFSPLLGTIRLSILSGIWWMTTPSSNQSSRRVFSYSVSLNPLIVEALTPIQIRKSDQNRIKFLQRLPISLIPDILVKQNKVCSFFQIGVKFPPRKQGILWSSPGSCITNLATPKWSVNRCSRLPV